MIDFIVKRAGCVAEDVTVDDTHSYTWRFGFTPEATAEAFAECLRMVERYDYPWPPRPSRH